MKKNDNARNILIKYDISNGCIYNPLKINLTKSMNCNKFTH